MSSVPFIFRCSAIEVNMNNENKIIICIYCHSSNVGSGIEIFFAKNLSCFEITNESMFKYIISGDINIHILSESKVS